MTSGVMGAVSRTCIDVMRTGAGHGPRPGARRTGPATAGQRCEDGMDGVRVGKRIIGAQAPVVVGWENIPRVEGGPLKRFVFTWFQPSLLFALIAFWYY